MRRFLIALGLILTCTYVAYASTTSLSVIISGPASTAVSCPLKQTSFTAPVVVGTVISTCFVSPSNWSGALTLSGANASLFGLSGMNLVVGASAIATPGTYDVTVTSTP